MMQPRNEDRLPTNIFPRHYDLAIKTDINEGVFEGKSII